MRENNQNLVSLSQHHSSGGAISVAEFGAELPFAVKRAYILHDLEHGIARGGHAHRTLQQLVIAVSGSFWVHTEGNFGKKSTLLDRPGVGLLIQPVTWRVIEDFSADARCLVLASELYDEGDYIRSYSEFLRESSNLQESRPSSVDAPS